KSRAFSTVNPSTSARPQFVQSPSRLYANVHTCVRIVTRRKVVTPQNYRASVISLLSGHIDAEDPFLCLVDEDASTNESARVDELQATNHVARAPLRYQPVNNYERQSKLRGPKFHVTDFQFRAGAECQKRAHVVGGEENDHYKQLVPRTLR